MPCIVRNFWITVRIDGRKSLVRGGPRNKDGGLVLTLYQRKEGGVSTALKITCTACADGTLYLSAEPILPVSLTTDGTLRINTRR